MAFRQPIHVRWPIIFYRNIFNIKFGAKITNILIYNAIKE